MIEKAMIEKAMIEKAMTESNKTERNDFLVEIGTEELPPKALRKLSESFAEGIRSELEKLELTHQEVILYASPRRLAVLINGLQTAQPDKTVQKRGPALQAAFDKDGKPSKAAIGFAKSCGLDSVDQLARLETDKGTWLVYDVSVAGKHARDLLPTVVQTSLDKLPIPKRMRWGTSTAQFVRPVHWIVMLLGDEIVEAEILTVKSGRTTYGHRFHQPKGIILKTPTDYAQRLQKEGQVIADFAQRRATIKTQVETIVKQVKGTAVIDDDLLDEVTSMVEWPVALLGNFDKRFLDVPSEVLITTMKTNQKYFYVIDDKANLLPHFITVSNIDSSNMNVVRQGNERVVRPRLVDAEFFWNQDRKIPLEAFAERLKSVVFQDKLGSIYEKTERTIKLAATIADKLAADVKRAKRAALLAKCDLTTDMVGEFPNLQGTMGKYYAQHSKEDPEVAMAIEEQYRPRFAGDQLPQTVTGSVLAIADKLDTLAGIFAIGQIPSGDKDPFGLRRAALGVLRIMVEGKLDLDLSALIVEALHNFAGTVEIADPAQVAHTLYQFMMERLRTYYADQNILAEVFESVMSQRPANPHDFDRRILAVTAFKQLAEAQSLAVANKRIANILKKADGEYEKHKLDSKLLSEPAEKTLAAELAKMEKAVSPLLAKREYESALAKMAGLRESVDKFFDDVMVMTDDKAQRQNRLALLAQLRGMFLRVADISRLDLS